MKDQLYIYYDEEGDFLEINLGEYAEGYFKNLGKGIFERIDKKTGKVTGITIHSFKQKTKDLKDLKIELPFKIQPIA